MRAKYYAIFLSILGLITGVASVQAATFTVNTFDDPAPVAAPNGCSNGGRCSLREAILSANSNGQDDAILLQEGTYHLTITGANEEQAATGDLDITEANHSVTISGVGPDKTIIDASGLGDRILDLGPEALESQITLNVNSLTLQNGDVTAATGTGNFGDDGGAIAVARNTGADNLNITKCNFFGNKAAQGGAVWIQNETQPTMIDQSVFSNNMSSDIGGAIFAWDSSILKISNSTVSQNNAGTDGGGIYVTNGSATTLTNSDISQNTASGNGGGIFATNGAALTITGSLMANNHASGDGGGIHGTNSASPIITNSTIANNTAGNDGGGLWGSTGGNPTINSSTISGNTASGSGGGINDFDDGPVKINNSTISGNQATTGGGISIAETNTFDVRSSTITANTSTGTGGGIFIPGPIGPNYNIANSIVGGNSSGTGSPDCFNGSGGPIVFTSLGHNVFSDVSSCITADPSDKDGIATANLGLGQLTNNGGPTETHALLAGSPALDNGDPNGCVDSDGVPLTQDQRGQNRKIGSACDSGSVEAGNTSLAISGSANPEPVTAGDDLTYSFTVSNGGPDKSLNVNFTDNLPAGTTFVSSNPSAGSCSDNGGVVTCDLGSLGANASATVVIVVTAPATAGTITNTASIEGSEIDTTPNDDTISIDSTVNAASNGGGGGGCRLGEVDFYFNRASWGLFALAVVSAWALRRRRA